MTPPGRPAGQGAQPAPARRSPAGRAGPRPAGARPTTGPAARPASAASRSRDAGRCGSCWRPGGARRGRCGWPRASRRRRSSATSWSWPPGAAFPSAGCPGAASTPRPGPTRPRACWPTPPRCPRCPSTSWSCRRRRARPAPFLLVFDGVTDPHNLGSLAAQRRVRRAPPGVVLARHRAVHVTPTVAKVAAGAIEHLPMAVVPGTPARLAELAKAGVWTVGLDRDGPVRLWDLELATEPVALVLGAEGRGLSRLAAAALRRDRDHPRAGRHRIAQRGRGRGGRLLRGRPPAVLESRLQGQRPSRAVVEACGSMGGMAGDQDQGTGNGQPAIVASPMLATLVDPRPWLARGHRDWIYERKLDGLRCVAVRNGASVELWSRNHKSFNARFPDVVGCPGRARRSTTSRSTASWSPSTATTSWASALCRSTDPRSPSSTASSTSSHLLGRDTRGSAARGPQEAARRIRGRRSPPPAGRSAPGDPAGLLSAACAPSVGKAWSPNGRTAPTWPAGRRTGASSSARPARSWSSVAGPSRTAPAAASALCWSATTTATGSATRARSAPVSAWQPSPSLSAELRPARSGRIPVRRCRRRTPRALGRAGAGGQCRLQRVDTRRPAPPSPLRRTPARQGPGDRRPGAAGLNWRRPAPGDGALRRKAGRPRWGRRIRRCG